MNCLCNPHLILSNIDRYYCFFIRKDCVKVFYEISRVHAIFMITILRPIFNNGKHLVPFCVIVLYFTRYALVKLMYKLSAVTHNGIIRLNLAINFRSINIYVDNRCFRCKICHYATSLSPIEP